MAPALLNPSRFGGGGGGGGGPTWDFRGLSALPAGWARRGVASETFDAAGMSATYAAGQSHYYTLPGPVTSGLLEAKIVSPNAYDSMIGPTQYSAAQGDGICGAFYQGAFYFLVTNASHVYNGTFIGAAATPFSPAWIRVRVAAGSAYVSRSADGVTWSSEISSGGFGPSVSEINIGSIYGTTAAATFEYVNWTTP